MILLIVKIHFLIVLFIVTVVLLVPFSIFMYGTLMQMIKEIRKND